MAGIGKTIGSAAVGSAKWLGKDILKSAFPGWRGSISATTKSIGADFVSSALPDLSSQASVAPIGHRGLTEEHDGPSNLYSHGIVAVLVTQLDCTEKLVLQWNQIKRDLS